MTFRVEVRMYYPSRGGGVERWELSRHEWTTRDAAQLYGVLSGDCQGHQWRVIEVPTVTTSEGAP